MEAKTQVAESGEGRAEGAFLGQGWENHIIGRPGTVRRTLRGTGPERQGSSQEGWRGGEPHFQTPLPPAVITLPSKYKGLVRGLCGNFYGNKRNDYMLPNSTVTQNLLAFGNSWEVQRIEGGDLVRFSR